MDKCFYDKVQMNIKNNMLLETLKSNFMKIIYCKKLLNILEIYKLENLNKNIAKNFVDKNKINNKWLDDNFKNIKNLFYIRGKRYNSLEYYDIYIMTIRIIKNLFGNNIISEKRILIDKIRYCYYILK